MSSLPPSGARNASSETPKLRTWASDRHDVRFRFQCTQCGKCCTGRGGRVRINERELQRIAEATRESVERVKDKFLRPNTGGGGGEWLLRQSPDDAHCVFLDGNKCSIYQGEGGCLCVS
jgi:Fe-S-cluster containining protein